MMPSEKETGFAALKGGDFAGAVQRLSAAIKQNPRDPAVYAYMGIALAQLNRPELALDHLSQAVRLSPQSAALRYNLGLTQEHLGHRHQAAESYQQAVILHPGHERAKQALARVSCPLTEVAAAAARPVPGLEAFILPGPPALPGSATPSRVATHPISPAADTTPSAYRAPHFLGTAEEPVA